MLSNRVDRILVALLRIKAHTRVYHRSGYQLWILGRITAYVWRVVLFKLLRNFVVYGFRLYLVDYTRYEYSTTRYGGSSGAMTDGELSLFRFAATPLVCRRVRSNSSCSVSRQRWQHWHIAVVVTPGITHYKFRKFDHGCLVLTCLLVAWTRKPRYAELNFVFTLSGTTAGSFVYVRRNTHG